MRYLERIDSRDRDDGTPHLKRLRQIPPETGRFLALLSSMAPDGLRIEIGTSAGYSTLWLALADRNERTKIITFEILGEKAQIARETFKVAGIEYLVELIVGDARQLLTRYNDIGFCFIDAEKEVYADCYEAVVPKLVPGGLLAADNVISHRDTLKLWLDRVREDGRVDSLVIPIGKGILLCRKNLIRTKK
jgi:predicted O-methyltransferase YrrM